MIILFKMTKNFKKYTVRSLKKVKIIKIIYLN